MKKTKLLLSLCFLLQAISTLTAQKHIEFYNRTGVEAEMTNFVNVFVDEVAKSRGQENEINKWQNVKQTILSGQDFKTFNDECKAAIRSAYTDAEINQVFADNEALNIQGSLVYESRPELTKQMYTIGKKFGATLDIQVQEILNENVLYRNGIYPDFEGISIPMDQKTFTWHYENEDGSFKAVFHATYLDPAIKKKLYDYYNTPIKDHPNLGLEHFTPSTYKNFYIFKPATSLNKRVFKLIDTDVTFYKKESNGQYRTISWYNDFYLSNTKEAYNPIHALEFQKNKKNYTSIASRKWKYVITEYRTIEIINTKRISNGRAKAATEGCAVWSVDKTLYKIDNSYFTSSTLQCDSPISCPGIDKNCANKDGYSSIFNIGTCKCDYTNLTLIANQDEKELKDTFCNSFNATDYNLYQYLEYFSKTANYIKYGGDYFSLSNQEKQRRAAIAELLSNLSADYLYGSKEFKPYNFGRVFTELCNSNWFNIQKSQIEPYLN